MDSGIAIGSILLLVAAAILQLTRHWRLGAWLLVVFPVCLMAAGAVDLSRGMGALGPGAYRSDLKETGFCLAMLLLTLLAAFQRKLRWPFWVAWVLNSGVCAVIVYLVFFWKVFR